MLQTESNTLTILAIRLLRLAKLGGEFIRNAESFFPARSRTVADSPYLCALRRAYRADVAARFKRKTAEGLYVPVADTVPEGALSVDVGAGKFHARYDRELERQRKKLDYVDEVPPHAAKVLLAEHVVRVLRALSRGFRAGEREGILVGEYLELLEGIEGLEMHMKARTGESGTGLWGIWGRIRAWSSVDGGAEEYRQKFAAVQAQAQRVEAAARLTDYAGVGGGGKGALENWVDADTRVKEVGVALGGKVWRRVLEARVIGEVCLGLFAEVEEREQRCALSRFEQRMEDIAWGIGVGVGRRDSGLGLETGAEEDEEEEEEVQVIEVEEEGEKIVDESGYDGDSDDEEEIDEDEDEEVLELPYSGFWRKWYWE